jgi:hypothetical protein
MKKLSLMVIVALLAYQTSAVAQTTTPTKSKTSSKKNTKTIQPANNLHGEQYSTSDRSGLNSYHAATDTTALGSGTTDQNGQHGTTVKATKAKKSSKKTIGKG